MAGEVGNDDNTVVGFIRNALGRLEDAVAEVRADVKKLLPLENRVEELENWRWKEANPTLTDYRDDRAKRRGVREDAAHDGNVIQIRYFKYGVFGLAASVLIAAISLVLALHAAHILF